MSGWKDDLEMRKGRFGVFRDVVDLQMKWINHCLQVQAKLIELESEKVDLWIKYQRAIGRQISLNQARIDFRALNQTRRDIRRRLAFFLKMSRHLTKVYDPDALNTATSRHLFWQGFTFCSRTVGHEFWDVIREMQLTSQQLEDSYSTVVNGRFLPWQWDDYPSTVYSWLFNLKQKRIILPYSGSPAHFLLLDIIETLPPLVEQSIIKLRTHIDDETNRVYGIWHPEKSFGV